MTVRFLSTVSMISSFYLKTLPDLLIRVGLSIAAAFTLNLALLLLLQPMQTISLAIHETFAKLSTELSMGMARSLMATLTRSILQQVQQVLGFKSSAKHSEVIGKETDIELEALEIKLAHS